MRVLGFQKQWTNFETGRPKLHHVEFSTFRFPRKDRDWEVGEVVKVVLKPRTKERQELGEAVIISKVPKPLSEITGMEALRDGFRNHDEIIDFLSRDPKFLRGANPNLLVLKWKIACIYRT